MEFNWEERIKLIENYKKGKEYKEKLEKVMDYKSYLAKLLEENLQVVKDSYLHKYDNISNKKYAIGGKTFHRGVLFPSPVSDLTIGNSNRGRFTSSERKSDWEYGFNNDNLVYVKQKDKSGAHLYEYVIYINGKEVSFIFDKFDSLDAITLCQFNDDKIVLYIYGFVSDEKIVGLEIEEYYYTNEGIFKMDIYSYFKNLSHRQYEFKHSPDGHLISYRAKDVNGIEDKEAENRVYQI